MLKKKNIFLRCGCRTKSHTYLVHTPANLFTASTRNTITTNTHTSSTPSPPPYSSRYGFSISERGCWPGDRLPLSWSHFLPRASSLEKLKITLLLCLHFAHVTNSQTASSTQSAPVVVLGGSLQGDPNSEAGRWIFDHISPFLKA